MIDRLEETAKNIAYSQMVGKAVSACDTDTAQGYSQNEKYPQASVLGATSQGRRYSMAEESYKASQHHREQADKAAQAAEFFQLHPEFEQFIKLIRSGAIHI